jgi:hypothetical protein
VYAKQRVSPVCLISFQAEAVLRRDEVSLLLLLLLSMSLATVGNNEAAFDMTFIVMCRHAARFHYDGQCRLTMTKWTEPGGCSGRQDQGYPAQGGSNGGQA